LLRYEAGGLQKILVSFDRHQARHDAHQRGVRCQTELAAELAAFHVQKPTQLQAQRNGQQLVTRRDAVSSDLVALALADHHEPIRHPRQNPLDAQKHTCLDLAEVAVKDVAVIGMHHERHATHCRRQPSYGACLCHVRVDDVWPRLSDQLDHPGQRNQVVDRADLSPERRHHNRLDTSRLCQVGQVALMRRRHPRHQRRREHPPVVERLGQQNRMDGWPADVQARDHAQDSDRPDWHRGEYTWRVVGLGSRVARRSLPATRDSRPEA
jgi:hypothetical protein